MTIRHLTYQKPLIGKANQLWFIYHNRPAQKLHRCLFVLSTQQSWN